MKKDANSITKELGFSLLAEGKTLRIRADGYSMFPAIKAGYFIFIEPYSDPSPGDIIAWKRETGFVVHRLVKVLNEGTRVYFITRGDSCPNEDQPVKKDQIAGKVVSIECISGKKKTIEKKKLSRIDYIYNRLLVWFIIRFKRVRDKGKQIFNAQ
jgi:signal peptidase I